MNTFLELTVQNWCSYELCTERSPASPAYPPRRVQSKWHWSDFASLIFMCPCPNVKVRVSSSSPLKLVSWMPSPKKSSPQWNSEEREREGEKVDTMCVIKGCTMVSENGYERWKREKEIKRSARFNLNFLPFTLWLGCDCLWWTMEWQLSCLQLKTHKKESNLTRLALQLSWHFCLSVTVFVCPSSSSSSFIFLPHRATNVTIGILHLMAFSLVTESLSNKQLNLFTNTRWREREREREHLDLSKWFESTLWTIVALFNGTWTKKSKRGKGGKEKLLLRKKTPWQLNHLASFEFKSFHPNHCTFFTLSYSVPYSLVQLTTHTLERWL